MSSLMPTHRLTSFTVPASSPSPSRRQPTFAGNVLDERVAQPIVTEALRKTEACLHAEPDKVQWMAHAETPEGIRDEYWVPRAPGLSSALGTFSITREMNPKTGHTLYSLADHCPEPQSPGVAITYTRARNTRQSLWISQSEEPFTEGSVQSEAAREQVGQFFQQFFSSEKQAELRKTWFDALAAEKRKQLEAKLAGLTELQAQPRLTPEQLPKMQRVFGEDYAERFNALVYNA